MPAPRKYDPETRDRAVRMYRERRNSHPAESMMASRKHVGGLLGINSETLRSWIERAEVNAGVRPGVSDAESETFRALRKENAELKRANDILKVARVTSRLVDVTLVQPNPPALLDRLPAARRVRTAPPAR